MTNLTSLVNQLQKERSRLTAQLERLTSAISALSGVNNTRRGRAISVAGRARIAAAGAADARERFSLDRQIAAHLELYADAG